MKKWFHNVNEGIAYKYIIDENKGVVTCQIRSLMSHENQVCTTTYKPYDAFLTYCLQKLIGKSSSYVYMNENKIVSDDYRTIGVAKCNLEKDVFDVERGKEIAYRRAYKKLLKYRLNAIKKLQKDINKLNDVIGEFYDLLETKQEKGLKKLNDLVN